MARFAILLAGCVWFASTAFAQHDAAERAAWNQPIAPFRIAGNLYYVGVAGVSAFLITTPAGHVLLDGGLPESAPRIADSIVALGFKLADVKWLLNSHAHFDHAGGLAELERRTHAKVAASRADGVALAAGKADDLGSGASSFPPVSVDRFLDDGAAIVLGGTVLTAHITPGHTKGCTTWTMDVTDGAERHHVVLHCSTSAPGYRLVDNPVYPRIAADYASTFAKLRALPCDLFLGPHGSFFHLDDKRARIGKPGPNPFVDANEWHAFLDRSEAEFNAELARQTAARR